MVAVLVMAEAVVAVVVVVEEREEGRVDGFKRRRG